MKYFAIAVGVILAVTSAAAQDVRNIEARDARATSNEVTMSSEFLVEPLDQARGIASQSHPDVAIANGNPFVIWSEGGSWRGIVPGAASSELIDPLAGNVNAAITASNDAHLVVIGGQDGWLRYDATHHDRIVIEPYASQETFPNSVASNGSSFALGYRPTWSATWNFAVFDRAGGILNEIVLPKPYDRDVFEVTVSRFGTGYIALWTEYQACRFECIPAGSVRALRFDDAGAPIDAAPYEIVPASSSSYLNSFVAVASSPSGALVVWTEVDASSGRGRIVATHLDADGQPIDKTDGIAGVELPVASSGSTFRSSDVAWDGEHFVVVASAYDASAGARIAGWLVPDEPSNAESFTVLQEPAGNRVTDFYARVAGFGGGKSIVVYEKTLEGQPAISRIFGRTIGTAERRRLIRR